MTVRTGVDTSVTVRTGRGGDQWDCQNWGGGGTSVTVRTGVGTSVTVRTGVGTSVTVRTGVGTNGTVRTRGRGYQWDCQNWSGYQ